MIRTAAVAAIAAFLGMSGAAQVGGRQGTVYRAQSGVTLRLILDEHNVGSDVSLGEISFPPGYVKPPDKVRHRTGASGATAVVVWVPGDEARRIVTRWTREP